MPLNPFIPGGLNLRTPIDVLSLSTGLRLSQAGSVSLGLVAMELRMATTF